MRILAIVKKALIMQVRDLWALVLTIAAAPFFILLYFLMTGGGSTTYTVLFHYADARHSMEMKNEFVHALKSVTYNKGPVALDLVEIRDTAEAKTSIRNRKADVLILIPEGFSDSLKDGRIPHFLVYGEASNPKYSIGLIFSITGIESLVRKYSSAKPMYTFREYFMGNSEVKSEFDVYVPGIFVFSMIMLILSCSLAFIRDVEDRTMLRLKLSRMTVFDYLIGNTLVQWAIGIISFALTLWLAIALGFNSIGAMWLVLLVCSLTILSVIAISLILVSFCRNASMVMIIGNFPLFILMFFSGSMLPLPRYELFGSFALNDLLPPTHAVMAMNKIFTYGAGIREIGYEIGMLSALTIVYYTAGIYLFNKKHLEKA
jgi:ABC-2 type transport system permease protein